MSTAINLAELPAPEVVETLDYEAILKSMLDDLRTRLPEFTATVEADPAYKILEVAAYRELLLRQRINDSARAVMLAYATGPDLDNLAALFNIQRQQIQKADPQTFPPKPARYESDPDLRRRTQLALEQLALAGTEKSYVFEALSAHPHIRDATAISEAPGEVTVTVLSHAKKGKTSPDIIKTVNRALHQETVRTLTDKITVQAGHVAPYTIKATLFAEQTPASEVILQEARTRLKAYTQEQFALGKNIRRSAVASTLHVTGVQHVVIEQPEQDLIFDAQTAGHCTAIALEHAGADA